MYLLEAQDGWVHTVGRRNPRSQDTTLWLWILRARSGLGLGKLQAATADFVFKLDFNLEIFGQPNIEPNTHFTAQLMPSSRAADNDPDDLIPGNGRRYPQQCSSNFVAT